MALRERLDADLKAAMLAKETVKLSALRMIKSAVRNKEIDLKKTLDDTEMIAICSTIKKQWEETLAQAKAGGRQDVVDSQTAELAIVQSFLPAALSDSELDGIIGQAITTVGAAGPKDMGKVMKAITDQTKGRADGKVVSERVKAKLEQLGK
ncbi:MAG: GatB/YqeY domain-containing protein [Deltaproteobacteria bacterium]|nr:GatB/YqeY domain-containing protein [Deltaproteobacteria bacterium]